MLHAFSRTELLLGADAIERLKHSKVAIFGIGGVGSFAVEAMVRSGVGRFVLVDDDLVCLTNLNRQLHATRRTVGKPKVEVMRDRILEINPKAEVDVRRVFYEPGMADALLDPDVDYVVDAIDTVTCKIDLIVACQQRHLPIISAMGAGNKQDPTAFQVADLADTTVCPLARVMRKELRKRGVKHLKVVYSQELPMTPMPSEASDCNLHCVCPKGAERTCLERRTIPGSLAFVPSVMGLIMGGEVVKDLVARPRRTADLEAIDEAR